MMRFMRFVKREINYSKINSNKKIELKVYSFNERSITCYKGAELKVK